MVRSKHSKRRVIKTECYKKKSKYWKKKNMKYIGLIPYKHGNEVMRKTTAEKARERL